MNTICRTVTLIILLFAGQHAWAQNFITQWNLATAGSGATQLSFGTATSGSVNYTWQEISPGSASGSGSWSGATLTITGLPASAVIRLQIAPTNFQRIIINTGTDRNRLTRVEQWGTTNWTSMQNAFSGCANLQVTATDLPDLSGVTIMSGMFRFCTTLNSPTNIGSWNTSVVTDMSALFSQASAFNQNISSWNTAAVTNMSNLFADAAAFNQDIGVWNTASVTNMAGMFAGALIFNRNIGAWNTAAVNNMSSMFFSAYAFNQNISGWNTAAVTNMSSMFGYAHNFNQNIGTWNTSAVTSMSRMFEDAFDFNQNIGVWNTSAVTNMRGMFIDAYAFNQNIGTWNTSAVTDMSRMFDFATAFNQNIGAWNTAAVTTMSGMFADASDFNQNIGTWSLNPVVNLTGMFNNSNMDCSTYSATLIGWNANPSTPTGRTLGATGRQYGTNAVGARTNLTATKGWTITGDTPSGAVCSIPSATITSFTPASGPIGTTITITGTNFSTTIANNIVFFGATRATVTSATATQLTVTVPAGATYQPISVLVNGLTAFSAKPFNVTVCSVPGITSGSFATPVNFGTGASSGPVSISVGDLDGDGKADLIVANRFANTVSVLRNTSSAPGTISYAPKIDLATGSEPVSITFGDLDGDGRGDLAVAVFGEAIVSVYRNTSSGPGTISFAPKQDFSTGAPGAGPFSVALSDVDKDGKVDLAVANYLSNQASVLLNTSSGLGNISFAARVDFPTGAGAGSYSIFVGDIDLDGKDDLVTSNANNNSVSVFRNTSSGVGNISYATSVNFSTGTTPRSVSLADLDGDNKLDLAVTAENPDIVSIFRNISSAGSISFAARQDFSTDTNPWFVAIGDLDGDGKPDLATANEGGVNISVLHNTSTGVGNVSFSAKVDFSGGGGLVAMSLGDFDNDGKSEMVAAEFNGDVVSVFRNIIPTTPPTITSFSPTSGNIGTTVTINGTNFDTTPTNNTVLFNGTAAVVTASTATSLTTTVPTSAITGKISVTVGCNTEVSADDFTVSTINQPPIIEPTTSAVPIEGIITLDLETLISDPDDNLDPNSLYLVNSVSEQGASASLDEAFNLTLDYGGIQFFGTDRITIGVCDFLAACAEQELIIEVRGDVVVYNAVSADGNGLNDTFFLQYIDILPNTASNHVSIFNRWGDLVFEITNYNNQDRVFKGLSNSGKELPSGTYYYKIEFSGKTKTGYLSLKR
jgi:gliding motility-associated-like protein